MSLVQELRSWVWFSGYEFCSAGQASQKVKPMTGLQHIAIGKPHTSLPDLLAAISQRRRTKAEQRHDAMGRQSRQVWTFQPEHEVHLGVIAAVSFFWSLIENPLTSIQSFPLLSIWQALNWSLGAKVLKWWKKLAVSPVVCRIFVTCRAWD